MIDAEHTNAGLVRDLGAVRPLLAEQNAVFIHDAHCFEPELIAGAHWFPECRLPHGWNLAVIENLASDDSQNLSSGAEQIKAA
jgi:hypothetical protein